MNFIKEIKEEWQEFVSARRKIKLLEKQNKWLRERNARFIQEKYKAAQDTMRKILNK